MMNEADWGWMRLTRQAVSVTSLGHAAPLPFMSFAPFLLVITL